MFRPCVAYFTLGRAKMTFSWDFNTATLLAIIVQAVVLLRYLFKTESRAKRAEEKAAEAHSHAEKAHNHAEEAHTKVAALSGQLQMHRELVAREYISKDDLKDIKDAINYLRKRIDELLSRWGER